MYFSADKTFIGDGELFDIELMEMEDGTVSVLGIYILLDVERVVTCAGAHGHYISANTEGKVFATRDKQGKSETFERVVLSPTQVAFKSAHGRYLSAEADGMCNLLFVVAAHDTHYYNCVRADVHAREKRQRRDLLYTPSSKQQILH